MRTFAASLLAGMALYSVVQYIRNDFASAIYWLLFALTMNAILEWV